MKIAETFQRAYIVLSNLVYFKKVLNHQNQIRYIRRKSKS